MLERHLSGWTTWPATRSTIINIKILMLAYTVREKAWDAFCAPKWTDGHGIMALLWTRGPIMGRQMDRGAPDPGARAAIVY